MKNDNQLAILFTLANMVRLVQDRILKYIKKSGDEPKTCLKMKSEAIHLKNFA